MSLSELFRYTLGLTYNHFNSIDNTLSKKPLLKGKAKQSLPPCAKQFGSAAFYIENIIFLFYKTIYLNEEVNLFTKPSPSVSFPCPIICLSTFPVLDLCRSVRQFQNTLAYMFVAIHKSSEKLYIIFGNRINELLLKYTNVEMLVSSKECISLVCERARFTSTFLFLLSWQVHPNQQIWQNNSLSGWSFSVEFR